MTRHKLRIPKSLVWTALGGAAAFASVACSSGTSSPIACPDCGDSAVADHEAVDSKVADDRFVQDHAVADRAVADRSLTDHFLGEGAASKDSPISTEAALMDRRVAEASTDAPSEAALVDQGLPPLDAEPDGLLG